MYLMLSQACLQIYISLKNLFVLMQLSDVFMQITIDCSVTKMHHVRMHYK